MGQRVTQEWNTRKVQETSKTSICAPEEYFVVNWPAHTWLWAWGLRSGFRSSPLHCFFHCSTFWHFFSSLDLQNIANLVLIKFDFDFSILEQKSDLIYIRVSQHCPGLYNKKTKKYLRNKRLAALFKQKVSTERPSRELCSTVLNKNYCFPGHPTCSIFRGGPRNIISRNIMLAERAGFPRGEFGQDTFTNSLHLQTLTCIENIPTLRSH